MRAIQLDHCCEFINGGSWSDKEYVTNGIPVLKVTNMKNGGFDFKDLSFLPESSFEKYSNHKLLKDDTVIATVGSHPTQPNSVVGRTSLVPELRSVYLLNQNAVCLRVTDTERLNKKYLFYFTKTKLFSHFASMWARGAANQVRLAISEIKKFRIPLPALPTQKKIASILSAYDDLIENNNQRIKLLEEIAAEIYKEWFVRMRFPGYQDCKFFDKEENEVPHGTPGALPEGWELKYADKFESYKISKSKIRKFEGEKVYHATADISGLRITGEGEIIDWDSKPSRAQLKPERDSVFFARMSDTYKVLAFTDSNKELVNQIVLSSGFLGLKAVNRYTFPFLFSLVKSVFFHKNKDVFANGATQVSLTNEGFHMIKLVEPSIDIIEEYGRKTYPLFDEINQLLKKNQVLQEIRDLLLPRLISGNLNVSRLEINEPENLSMAAELKVNY